VHCDVVVTEEFRDWYEGLLADEQLSVARVVGLLEELGIALPFPYSSGISGSRHSSMRELRIQHRGHPYRILFAFDPKRNAVLLVGGDKTGDSRWYEREVPKADRRFDIYLREWKSDEAL
jgi:hypothetical protein